MQSRKDSGSYLRGFGMSLILLALILNLSSSSPTFNSYPDYRIYTGELSATTVKISTDNRYVMVGFNSGRATIYYTSGSVYVYCNGHSSPIIAIEQIPNNGWITLDSSGKAIRWNSYGSLLYILSFNTSSVTDLSVASYNGNYWVAFNLGSSVIQYNALGNFNNYTKIYVPPAYTYIKKIQYPSGHSYLYASTNTSYVYQFDTVSGSYTSTLWYTYYAATDMDIVPGGNKEVLLLNYNYIFNFKDSTSSAEFVAYSESANLITSSYYNGETIYILANANISTYLYVHSTSGATIQTITYNSYAIRAIDASNTYLCAVDNYGYLLTFSFKPYTPDDYSKKDFPGWAIALITSVLFFICVAGIIMMSVKARKRRQAQIVNNYNKFNNQPINPQYFPNNQTIIPPPSEQQYSGNNINPQPAWNSNPQPQPYFNTYTQPGQPSVQPGQSNPYQANQPSNWS